MEGKLVALIDHPDWEMVYMDPRAPVWVFMNDKTHEICSIGNREVCEKARVGFAQTIKEMRAEELLKKEAA